MTLQEYKEQLAVLLGELHTENIKLFVHFDKFGGDWRNRELNGIEGHEFESDFYHEDHAVPFKVVLRDKEVTRFKLVEFPGCCAVMVSTGSSVDPKFRGKGVNQLTNKLRQQIAKNANYTAIICTDVDKNIAQRQTLKKNDWQDIFTLVNRRTSNKVHISIKELE